jgi:hypothetical protein
LIFFKIIDDFRIKNQSSIAQFIMQVWSCTGRRPSCEKFCRGCRPIARQHVEGAQPHARASLFDTRFEMPHTGWPQCEPSGGFALRHLFGTASCAGSTQGHIGHGQNSCAGFVAKCRAIGQVALTSAKFQGCACGGDLSACLPAAQSSRQSQDLGRFVCGCQFGEVDKRLSESVHLLNH